jgi:hypothetical protein
LGGFHAAQSGVATAQKDDFLLRPFFRSVAKYLASFLPSSSGVHWKPHADFTWKPVVARFFLLFKVDFALSLFCFSSP